MFFMTHKRFEEEVAKRIDDYHRHMENERELRRVYENLIKLEERVTRLEGKGKMDRGTKEVCNVYADA